MADLSITSENNGIRIGVITGLVLIGYTSLAAILGFLDKVEAGSLDILVLVAGVVFAIKRFKHSRGNRMPYLQGFGTGIITALVASVMLGAFFWLLGSISQKAMAEIQARDLFGVDWGVLISGLGIILMGTMSGVITSLIAMQYFKSPDHQTIASLD